MLAVAISLLFGLTAFTALAVIHAAVARGAGRARLILAELESGTRRARVQPVNPRAWRPAPARWPRLAAA